MLEIGDSDDDVGQVAKIRHLAKRAPMARFGQVGLRRRLASGKRTGVGGMMAR
jgi:hypothetical protein